MFVIFISKGTVFRWKPNKTLIYPKTSFLIFNFLVFFYGILDINAAPSTTDEESKGPVFLKEPVNRIDFSNSTGAVVECRASGNPAPEIIWVRSDGTAVGDVPGLRQVLSNGNLVFPPFQAEDYRQEVHAQAYACLAKNQFGSIISRDVNVRAGKQNVRCESNIFHVPNISFCFSIVKWRYRFERIVAQVDSCAVM